MDILMQSHMNNTKHEEVGGNVSDDEMELFFLSESWAADAWIIISHSDPSYLHWTLFSRTMTQDVNRLFCSISSLHFLLKS